MVEDVLPGGCSMHLFCFWSVTWIMMSNLHQSKFRKTKYEVDFRDLLTFKDLSPATQSSTLAASHPTTFPAGLNSQKNIQRGISSGRAHRVLDQAHPMSVELFQTSAVKCDNTGWV